MGDRRCLEQAGLGAFVLAHQLPTHPFNTPSLTTTPRPPRYVHLQRQAAQVHQDLLPSTLPRHSALVPPGRRCGRWPGAFTEGQPRPSSGERSALTSGPGRVARAQASSGSGVTTRSSTPEAHTSHARAQVTLRLPSLSPRPQDVCPRTESARFPKRFQPAHIAPPAPRATPKKKNPHQGAAPSPPHRSTRGAGAQKPIAPRTAKLEIGAVR